MEKGLGLFVPSRVLHDDGSEAIELCLVVQADPRGAGYGGVGLVEGCAGVVEGSKGAGVFAGLRLSAGESGGGEGAVERIAAACRGAASGLCGRQGFTAAVAVLAGEQYLVAPSPTGPMRSNPLADEEFSGLLNRSIGAWLVQPNIFEMLEYKIPDNFTHDLLAAFSRLNATQPDVIDMRWMEDVFQDAFGRSMRELLDRSVKQPDRAVN
ncbi:hypothetical protein ACFXKW_28155 [Streptomyces sp. NPDC059193]|uniref:hypothetical protein n=1 Tax=Streptomyces sp. NPDC059193 TaxID=3346763 RepID=UPI0036CBAD4A